MRRRLTTVLFLSMAVAALLLVGGPVWVLVGAVALGAAAVLRRAYPIAPTVEGVGTSRSRLPPPSLFARWRLRRPPADELARRSQELAWALRDTRRAETTLRPALARTADALLLQRTERTITDDPAAARRLLGDDLVSYLTTRDAPPPTVPALAAMLTRLEGLR